MTSRRAALAIAALALAALAVTSLLVSSRPPRAINLQSTQFAGEAQTNPKATGAGPAQTSDSSADSSAPAASHVWPQPTPFTSHLVATLTNLDFTQGPITEEQAATWKHTLQRLTEQGPEAVPAIHEFLAQNRELDFTSDPDGELLGQSSLRSAMINALGQIGGPDASAGPLEALQTTTPPPGIPPPAQ